MILLLRAVDARTEHALHPEMRPPDLPGRGEPSSEPCVACLGLEGDTRKAHSAQEDVSVLIQLAQRLCQDAETDLYGLDRTSEPAEPEPKDNLEAMCTPPKDLPEQLHFLASK